jgi:hypothetical protein
MSTWGFFSRLTTGWVEVVLERAAVLEIGRSRPARVRLGRVGEWSALSGLGLSSPTITARVGTPLPKTPPASAGR